jgi:hypothetical protein
MSVLTGVHCPPCCGKQLPCDCVGDSYWSNSWTITLPYSITCTNSNPGVPGGVTTAQGTYTLTDGYAYQPWPPYYTPPTDAVCLYASPAAFQPYPYPDAWIQMFWTADTSGPIGIGWGLWLKVGDTLAVYTGPVFIDDTNPVTFTLKGFSGGPTGCTANFPPSLTVTPNLPRYCCEWCPGSATGNPPSVTLHSLYYCSGPNCGGQAHLGPPTITPCPCMVNSSQPNGFPATLTWNGIVGSAGQYQSPWVPSGCNNLFRFTLRCTLVFYCITQGIITHCFFTYGPQLHVEVQNCHETAQNGTQFTDWYASPLSCLGPANLWQCNPLCIIFSTDLHSIPSPYIPGCCQSMLCNDCTQFNPCDNGGCDLIYQGTLTA